MLGDNFFQQRLGEVMNPVHGVPLSEGEYDYQLEKICSVFTCDTISLVGEYSSMESYFYTTIPVFLLEYFDHYIEADRSIHFVIDSFSVVEEAGRR